MRVLPEVETKLAEFPKLLDWIRKNGTSGELRAIPETDAQAFTMKLVEGHPPIHTVLGEMREIVGRLRTASIDRVEGASDEVRVLLPLNAPQLHNLLAHEKVASVDFAVREQAHGMMR